MSRAVSVRRAALLGAGLATVLPAAALAAPHRTPDIPVRAYSATLEDAARERAVRTLDWRTPAVEVRFDLGHADIVRDLSLVLSADPLPGVDPSLPVTVQFNNGTPMTIDPKGRGFDATLALDSRRARPTGNVLRLSHAVPCDTLAGGYAVNLDQSRLSVKARAKSRRLQLREVESRLAASAFAPSTVGLVSNGPMATQFQALGAQAIGLRMQSVPDFRTGLAGSDFSLVMLRRDQLHAYTDDESVLGAEGPRVSLAQGQPDRLFLTGDTDAEVLSSVRAFATHFLPRSRRSHAAAGELFMQSPLDYARTSADGAVRLDALSVTTGAMREYTFDVADPAATSGDLVLRLTRDGETAPGARLKAVLNGESLGEARMDARRKTVSYPIRPGMLRGSGNRLELSTKAAGDQDSCSGVAPFIAIGAGSRMRLDAPRPSAATDLSRLAANGSVFGQDAGAHTHVRLPKRDADYHAALRVVARMGATTGHGWAEAAFSRDASTYDETRPHTVVIAPYNDIDATLSASAPRALQSAWRGQPMRGENRMASLDRFASLDAEEAVRLAARRLRASGDIAAGGVAAIFPDAGGGLNAVISNTPGQSFGASMRPLADTAHWNGLSGGVTRWNAEAVVMAQAALPGIGLPEAGRDDARAPWLERFVSLERRDVLRADWLDIEMPEWPETNVKARLSEAVEDASDWFAQARSLVARRDAATVAPSVQPEADTAVEPSTPSAPSLPSLRGPIELGSPATVKTSSAQGLGQRVRDIPRQTRRWVRRMEVKASRMRADLRRTTGVRAPSIGGLRLGGYVIPPAVLALALSSVLVLIGLVFVTSRSRNGAHH